MRMAYVTTPFSICMVKAQSSICLSNSCSSASISRCLETRSSTPSRRVEQLQTLEDVGHWEATAMAYQARALKKSMSNHGDNAITPEMCNSWSKAAKKPNMRCVSRL